MGPTLPRRPQRSSFRNQPYDLQLRKCELAHTASTWPCTTLVKRPR